jgi:hypothetical protein
MRKSLKFNVFLVIGVLCLGFSSPLPATLIYDNSTNDVLYRFDPGRAPWDPTLTLEVGDEIILKAGSTERYLTNFSFEFWGTNAVTPDVLSGQVEARVRFYENNGAPFNGYRRPGSQFYDSGWFPITATERSTAVFAGPDFCSGLYMPVSSNMTWSVQFRGIGPNDYVGVDIYTPATTGQNYPDYWQNDGTDNSPIWVLMTNSVVSMDFAARMEARNEPAPVSMEPPLLTCVRSGSYMRVYWPCDHIGWKLQAQTNTYSVGISAKWHTISNSALYNTWTFPIDPANGSVFCRLISP